MASDNGNHGALAAADPLPVLEQIRQGQSLRQIAQHFGVSQVGLRAWLLREDSDKYHEVITAALTTRVAEADEMLEQAADAVNIARAREIARFARMDLERRRPHLYGQRGQQISVSGDNVQVNVVSFAPQPATQQLTDDSE